MEFTYVKKSVKGNYITFPNQFIDELYDNIGTTYEDYQAGKWILLSKEQLAFREEHPEATVEEVINIAINPVPERTIEQAKSAKISEVTSYSYQAQRSVSYEGSDVWVDSYQRPVVKDEAEVAITNNIAEVNVTNDVAMAPENAISLLSVMTERDKEVSKVRASKIEAINALETIEDVDSYDATEGFPAKAEMTSEALVKKTETEANNLPEKQVLRLFTMKINTMELTDDEALEVKLLYPEWKTFIGKSLEPGMRVLHKGVLYNVLQTVNPVLENHEPSINTAALYTEINETNAGTYEDPIPYNNNMALENGKYYIQNEVIYRCTRDTGIPVYQNLSDLVGIYVEVATEG